MSAEPSPPDLPPARYGQFDELSQRWIEQLRPDHPRHEETVAAFHAMLLRVAARELSRRGNQIGATGPEFDDLASQAANDALLAVMSKLGEFRGLSRFTTWAYKFVIFEVSSKVARHAWNRNPPEHEELEFERLPDPQALRPVDRVEQQEQLDALSAAIRRLGDRQRRVFVAVALNEVPIDVLATELDSTRNAIYKSLFDARRNLRANMAAAGHPVAEEDDR